mgnify:CR=1 FL=1
MDYAYEDFGYRVYDHVEKKVVRSKDVVFIENQTIEDIDKGDNPKFSDDIPASSNQDPEPLPQPVDCDHGGVGTKQREDIYDNDTAINEFE